MIIVVFEVTPRPGQGDRYFDLAAHLRPDLEKIDGFISIERFESLAQEGKYLSFSVWRDEEAVAAWRRHAGHQAAQQQGKDAIFAHYRIRVARVIRDYGIGGRTTAP